MWVIEVSVRIGTTGARARSGPTLNRRSYAFNFVQIQFNCKWPFVPVTDRLRSVETVRRLRRVVASASPAGAESQAARAGRVLVPCRLP